MYLESGDRALRILDTQGKEDYILRTKIPKDLDVFLMSLRPRPHPSSFRYSR